MWRCDAYHILNFSFSAIVILPSKEIDEITGRGREAMKHLSPKIIGLAAAAVMITIGFASEQVMAKSGGLHPDVLSTGAINADWTQHPVTPGPGAVPQPQNYLVTMQCEIISSSDIGQTLRLTNPLGSPYLVPGSTINLFTGDGEYVTTRTLETVLPTGGHVEVTWPTIEQGCRAVGRN
jgi:hypothetical protein